MDGTLTVARSIAEAESLRDQWKAAGVTSIDSDIDYFLAIVKHAPNVIRPHVIHVSRNGLPDLLAVARIEKVPIPLQFGYRKLGSVEMRAVVVAFGGLSGARGQADEELLLGRLMEPVDAGEADLLLLRDLDLDGTLIRAVRARCGWLRRSHGETASGRWMMRLPDSFDGLLADRPAKTRRRLARQDRKTRSDFHDRLELRRFDRPEHLADLRAGLQHVASRSYQRGLGVGYLDTPLDLTLLELGLKQGWHRTWMLYLDKLPVAFWTGALSGGTFTLGTPGFDSAYGPASFGRFTMLRMVEDLCRDPAAHMLDFGAGDAEYKARFGFCQRQEQRLYLTSRQLMPIVYMLVRSALSGVNNQGRRMLAQAEWGKRLKRRWRAHLGKPEAAT